MESPKTSLAIIAERLKRAEIFQSLSNEDLLDIAEFCHEEEHDKDVVIFVEGEAAEKLAVVERGKLSLEKKVQIGMHTTPRNATLGYVGPGGIAGFSTLTEPHVYSTSVITVEPTRLTIVDGVALRQYLQTHPVAGWQVMTALATLIGERYRQSTHTLTYFLSIVSHELRAPLAAVENYLQTLHGGFAGDLTPKQQRMIQRSILRIKELRSLIGDVVDLARMRPEQIQADFEWFDPGEVGAESIEDVSLAAAEKNIRIKVEPPPKFEPIVGARWRLRQVFTNLLNNAIRYSPADSTVIFRARYEPEHVIFEVQDNGPGIPDEDLPHIFTDFYRGSQVAETQGLGLGLSIAKKIVDAHHGQILVRNLSGEGNGSGACFTVILPRNLKTPEMQRQMRSEGEVREKGTL